MDSRTSKTPQNVSSKTSAYPWDAIYTTNYDNGLEIALQSAGRKFTPVNNLDDPNADTSGVPVIHLHGYAIDWNDVSFEQSCVLDADSYRHLSGVSKWLRRLRFDIERAELVLFIGFSAADFHLSQTFFNTSGLREKAFFINPPSCSPDPDERATQEDFGKPLYIGREECARLISETLRQQVPVEPRLASFRRFSVPQPSASVPPVGDIEDLFIWGKVVKEHVKRDLDIHKSDYHIVRGEVLQIADYVDAGGRAALIHGDICEGKSLVVLGASINLASKRPVFELRHSYTDILNEFSLILLSYPNAVFVIENCFSLREDHLVGVVRLVSASQGSLIISARDISTEAEMGKIKGIREIGSLLEIKIGRLQSQSVDLLISLIDQIAGWRDFRTLTPADRRRFVESECNYVIPSVLLRLLNSEYVRTKYREEYNKTSHIDPADRQMIVAALLIANIGFDAPLGFISDIFSRDFASVLRRTSNHGRGLRLVRLNNGVVQTVPSIGARNILINIVDDKDIVNTSITLLEKKGRKC